MQQYSESATVSPIGDEPPRVPKAPSNGELSGRLNTSPTPVLSAAAFAFPLSYAGMAQGPFLMSTPRSDSHPAYAGLSLAAPSWHSPKTTAAFPASRPRALSRGPGSGVASARTDDDSFYGGPSTTHESWRQYSPLPSGTIAALTEPQLSTASPVISRARASTFSVLPSSSMHNGTGDGFASGAVAGAAPAVGGVPCLSLSSEVSPRGSHHHHHRHHSGYSMGGSSSLTAAAVVSGGGGASYYAGANSTTNNATSVYSAGAASPVMRMAGPSSTYGMKSLYQHHRSATTNSIGSTGTSISRCHLSRKEEHIDPTNMVLAGSRELRGRQGGGLYSASTLGTTSASLLEDRSYSVASGHNQSNSFYQPLHEQPCSPSCSLGSVLVETFDAPTLTRHDDSRYSMHSGHGAPGCSASRSITYADAPDTPVSATVPNEEATDDGDDVLGDQASPRSASDDDDETDAHDANSVSQATYSFYDEDKALRSSSPVALSPLEKSAEVGTPVRVYAVVAPPAGERRQLFVRRQLIVASGGCPTTDSTTLPLPAALAADSTTARTVSSSCPAHVFDDFFDRPDEDTDDVRSPSEPRGTTQSAARPSPVSSQTTAAGDGKCARDTSPHDFEVVNSFDTKTAHKKGGRAERSASF